MRADNGKPIARTSGWNTIDGTGTGTATSPETERMAIVQSGIAAQSFGAQGAPSFICIIGTAIGVAAA